MKKTAENMLVEQSANALPRIEKIPQGALSRRDAFRIRIEVPGFNLLELVLTPIAQRFNLRGPRRYTAIKE